MKSSAASFQWSFLAAFVLYTWMSPCLCKADPSDYDLYRLPNNILIDLNKLVSVSKSTDGGLNLSPGGISSLPHGNYDDLRDRLLATKHWVSCRANPELRLVWKVVNLRFETGFQYTPGTIDILYVNGNPCPISDPEERKRLRKEFGVN